MKNVPLIMFLIAFPLTLRAAEQPFPNPAAQPLAVLRAHNAEAIKSVLETRQAKALGLDEKDFAGKIPGIGAQLDSAKAFLNELIRAGAKNIWYGLLQTGSSLVNQSGAMGWESANADAPLPDTGGADVTTNGNRIVISRDAETRREFFPNSAERKQTPQDAAWRNSLASFWESRENTVGAWLNARPLFGLATLLSGSDLRAFFTARTMRPPVWARLELSNDKNNGDLSFALHTENILPKEIQNSPAPLRIHNGQDALAELHFPAPETLWHALRIDRQLFALANIDIESLIPRAVGVSIRKSASGQPTWSAAGLLRDGERAKEQLRRVHEVMKILPAEPSSKFSIEETRSTRGDAVLHIRVGKKVSLTAGVATVGERSFLIVSPTPEDFPNPEAITVETAPDPRIAEWQAAPDPSSRREIITMLATFFGKKGASNLAGKPGEAFFEAFLPRENRGTLRLEGDALVMESQ